MADQSQYKYSAMSNLVLQADRRFVSKRTDEATGDPESLAGRLSIRDMGSRVAREAAPRRPTRRGQLQLERGDIREGEDVLKEQQQRRRRAQAPSGGGAPSHARETGLLGAGEVAVEGITYRPRTAATRETFNLLLTLGTRYLGDVPPEVVRSAVDAVLEYLKDDDLRDADKKREIDEILGLKLSPEEFHQLVSLGKKITDYDAQDDDEEAGAGAREGGEDGEIDDRQGVAVAFDDDDGDGDGEDEVVGEVRDVSSGDEGSVNGGGDGDDDDDEHDDQAPAADRASDGSSDEDEIVLTAVPKDRDDDGGGDGAGGRRREDEAVPAREIDAYWLQRQIGKIYPDAHEQTDKTKAALRILSGEPDQPEDDEKDLREIENDLMELFEYEHPDLVRKLVKNREKVLWLTRLARAEEGEPRVTVEREMASEGLGWILNELYGRTGGGDEAGRRKIEVKLKSDDTRMDIDSGAGAGPGEQGADRDSDEDEKKKQKKKRKDQAGFLVGGLAPRKTINLENLVFEQGNHLMTNAKVRLPEGSTKRTFKGYEEIHVPIPKKRRPEGDGAAGEPGLMPVDDMPQWAQVPFAKNRTLNRIQTACYASAFGDDGNLLVCAPTGSGKTNVAMLAMLRVIGQHRRPDTGEIDLEGFKIICIAPLKALVQEQVRNYQARLEPYGIRVAELTGDRQLTKQQIAETQVIVTTPEKWDVITRKATDLTYTTSLVRLIVIDEIHLLHDERGPVIESIVSRTIRRGEQHRRSSAGAENSTRIVGLSATLPNYADVAAFLRVDRDRGLFHFDGSFRPCPLRQEFVGVTDRKAIRQLKVMNEVAYGKVLEHVGKNRNQTLIFVHSRKETARTARYIRDRAVEQDTISQILRQGGDGGGGGSTRELLTDAASQASDRDLQDLLPYGFGIHHAGMSRADRSDVEDLFERGAIRVLVCTSTLAWGVNLPAHTVIIKGTQVYLPERGGWVELSPQDVLQMLGRAGRPQYDTYGEGIVITTQSEMPYYLSLLNQQLPIESQLVGRLIDSLNAEVVLGNVRTRDEGVNWLGYTYLYVRMLMAPGLYQVGAEYEDDRFLEQKRVDLVHSAAIALRDSGLARYDAKTGRLQATDLGRIASHYYITHRSMLEYNQHMGPGATAVDLFRIFAKSDEFRHIPVRQDEKAELARLLQRVPVPVKEGVDEPAAKVNVLLQAYISRLRLDGLALMADMVYVTQSAGRILRAMFEIALRRGWASVATTALDLCKMAEQRMWPTMTPLRQLLLPLNGPGTTGGGGGGGIGVDGAARIIQKAERVEVPWESYFDLDPPRMGELLGMPKLGRAVCDLVSKFPRLHVRADCRPVTPSLLHFRLTITPKFVWDDFLHGAAQSFWVLLEDGDGEELLWHDQFVLRRDLASAETEHYVDLTVPIADPRPPHYFVSVVSDRWMESRTRMPIVFHRLVLPDRFPPHTELLKLQPLPPAAGLKKGASAGTGAAEAAEAAALLYPGWAAFNQIQSQTFNTLYGTDSSVFVGAPTGSGKTACAEFALLRLWASASPSGPDGGRAVAVYLAPMPDLVELRFRDWHARLSPLRGGREIVRLTGDVAVDLGLLGRADLVLATPREWDALSRQWRRRAAVRAVRLLIADDIHLLGSSPSTSTSSAAAAAGGGGGALYEVVVSRMLQIRAQTSEPLRIVALSVPLADARDLGEWIGAGRHEIYNFNPTVRPIPLALHVQSYSVPHFPSLMLTMAKPAYLAITQLSPTGRAIVFVPNRRQTRATARDLLAACQADADDDDDDDGDGDGEQSDRFLHADRKQLAPILERVSEEALAEALRHGIGYYHEALGAADRRIVRHLFDRGAIQVLVASRDVCWELDCAAHLVIVMGTQYYDGLEHRYVDYPVPDVLQMFGRAVEPSGEDSPQGVLMVPATRREYYKKFLTEALPVESQLPAALSDAFVTEISAGAITSGDDAVNWTTFTYFYRRLLANPTYYSLPGRTHDEVSNYLTDLVEGTLRELADAKLIAFDPDGDEEDGTEAGAVVAENAAAIAAYYAVSAATMETFLASLQARTRLRGVLEIVTAASELESVQIRRHEEPLLRRLHDHHLPVKMRDATADSPHFKAFVLLQAHFSRMSLPVDLARDQEVILTRVLPLLHAMVDILASEGHLNATHAMEMCQMVVQAMWDRDSPLKQIPGFGSATVETLKRYNVTNVFEFMEAMDPANANLVPLIQDIGMDTTALQKAAEFTNNQYPDIDLQKIEVLDPDAIRAGEPAHLTVHLVRTLDIEDDEADDGGEGEGEGEDKGDDKWEGKKKDLPPLDTTVHAPYFPVKKMENWWLVVADHGTSSLLGIKRVAVQREATVKIQFTVATAGQHALKLLLISDCYMGCDQEEEFSVTVAEGMEVDGDDDDDQGGDGDGSGDD